jgi:hypothetical protein
MAFLDVPYNVRVRSIGGRGRVKHAEFAFASGEMTPPEYVEFLEGALGNATRVSRDGAVHFVCCDWRHVTEIAEAGRRAYGETLNIVVWVKSNAGQGSFYRGQHEIRRCLPCRQRCVSEQHRTRAPRSFAFECLELPRRKYIRRRTCGGAEIRSDRQARRACCRCDAPLYSAPRHCPRYFFGLRDDYYGKRDSMPLRVPSLSTVIGIPTASRQATRRTRHWIRYR